MITTTAATKRDPKLANNWKSKPVEELSDAEIIAMPAGTRPLRRAVHPGAKPQEAINRVARETQLAMLGNSPYGPWVRAAQD